MKRLAVAVAGIGLLGLACGEKRDPYEIQEVILEVHRAADEEDLYRLAIPSGYLVVHDESGAALRAAYPGMIPYSPENRARFYDDGSMAADHVQIWLRAFSYSPYEGLKHRNPNDAGRRTFETRIEGRLEPVPLTEKIEASDRVTKYIGRYENSYVIEGDDQRVSVIGCHSRMCEGKTTWKGLFAIEYQFRTTHLRDIVHLDEAVLSLISSFDPEPLHRAGPPAQGRQAEPKPFR